MPNDEHAGEQQNQQGDQSTSKYNPQSLEEALKIIGALTKRVDERDSDLERYKGELKTFNEAQRKQLAEQGNFKALAEQHAAEVARLKPIEERASALEKIIRDGNEARIAEVPERMRSIIPTDYPPEKLQDWLNKNASLLAQPPPPDFDAGAGAGSSGNPSSMKLTADEKAMAKRIGVTEEEYLKIKARKQQES